MAREGYLLHGGEETIHQPEAEIKAENPKSKWENFWFYHKWHVIVAIFIIFVAAVTVYEAASKVSPDYEIGLITQTSYPDEAVAALETEVAERGTDLNGDGKVVVQVNSYVMAEDASAGTNPNVRMAGYVKLTSDLSNGSSMIFITDDASFRSEQEDIHMFSYTDGSLPAESATDYDKMRVSLKNTGLGNLKVVFSDGKSRNILDDLSISMRTYQGTQIASQKEKASYFNESKKLYNSIINNK